MRVLQVHKDFEPHLGGGGTARHIHGLGTALAAHGCEVRVIAPKPEAISSPYATYAATRTQFWQHIKWADVVHVHGARSSYAFAAALVSKALGKPFFYTPHAYYDNGSELNAFAKRRWDGTAERFLLRECHTTFLLTDAWRAVLASRGLPLDRTAIIPNCVTGSELAIKNLGTAVSKLDGSPAILSVGRLDPVKRLGDVVTALARPELAKAHLHIVGKGPERDSLEALALALGVKNRVTLHGFASDEEVSRMATGADVFVLASEQEGLPTVLLEMLIAKLPIACSRIPGNLAIATVAGVKAHFEVGDIASMAVALRDAATIPVSADAIAAIMKEFTWENRARDILNHYESALHPQRQAA